MSYYKILGLEKEPFSTSPQPDFFYLSCSHRSALANILMEIYSKRGLSVLLGEVGTGKTTLSRRVLQQLAPRENIDFYMIMDPCFKTEKLFLTSLIETFKIDIDASKNNILKCKSALKNFLFQKGVEEKKITVLLIDEAQKLDPVSLESLRILLNYETNEYKLLQVVLLGQLELVPILNKAENLIDRISSIQRLRPFTLQETKEMIDFRVGQAGYKKSQPLFPNEAIRQIYRYTGGYPRKIGMFCHKALKLSVMRDKSSVDSEIINEIENREAGLKWQRTEALQKRSC